MEGQKIVTSEKVKMKKGLKIALIVSIVIIVIFLITFSVIIWPLVKQTNKLQEQAKDYWSEQERIVKEDVYGGDTPEETYNMFRDAMLKKDIDTALLYVDPFNRDRAKNFFDKKISENKLDEYLREDLPPIEGMGKYEKRGFVYLTYEKYVPPFTVEVNGKQMPAGDYTGPFSIQLVQNSETNKWKIVSP